MYKLEPKTIKKMATRSYLSIITLNVNGLNAPTKRQRLAEWIQKQDLYICCMASLVAQTVKRLPEMQETWVPSLGREDPLEKEMATHSIVLAWIIPGMGEPGGLPSMGSHRVEHN